MMDINVDFLWPFIAFLIKKLLMKQLILFNEELEEELNKPIIRKSGKIKVHSPFIDNIWGANLADMLLISKFNKRFLLCVINIYSK